MNLDDRIWMWHPESDSEPFIGLRSDLEGDGNLVEIGPVIDSDLSSYQYALATAFDTETHLMDMCKLIPPMICCALATGDVSDLRSTAPADKAELEQNLAHLLTVDERPGERLVCANAAFDLGVLTGYYPEVLPHIFHLLEQGCVEDIFVREKLLHLASHGDLEYMSIYDQSGQQVSNIKLEYNLGALSQRYLGKNRQNQKEANDAWRKFYKELEGIPVSDWPKEAVDYVLEDATDTWHIREIQEKERIKVWQAIGIDPFKTQGFRVMASFCLHLMSAWGMCVDFEAKAKIEAMLAEALKPENMRLMVAAGILRPGSPPRPHARGAKNPDGTPKMTAGTEESINTKVLKDYIVKFSEERKLEVKRTDPSEKHPEGQVSTASEFFEDHQNDDPVFKEYYDRQVLQKLVTTELPRMRKADGTSAAVVHPNYDVIKSTGRTSSFASKIYPSFNCQNVDPRVRQCFVPRPGYLFFSIDYNQMELGTAAQKCYSLFGHSVLRDKINAGIDVHTYLGAQLAFNLHEDFNKSVCESSTAVNADLIYEAFAKCKKHESEEVRKFFAHYRKFAKPTGLGYPGGLGPKTFIDYAKATYGIEIDFPMAEKLRDTWRATFPEFVAYLKWISTSCQDLVDPDKYAYLSPMGMYRAGCAYCAAANGAALQTPSAEGAISSVISIVRACFDTELASILCDDSKGPVVRPIAFVHDEIIGEIREDGDRKLRHERLNYMAKLMVDGMAKITPDVIPRANPVLMERWNKDAEPVFGTDGYLDVWKPKERK